MFGGIPVDDPDGELCADCGAGLDEPCTDACECLSCERRRDQEPDGEAFRGGEAAAYDREQQADAQRLK